jgi:hypothetical protein
VNQPSSVSSSEEDWLAVAIRHGGRGFDEVFFEVLELGFLLADVANPDGEFDRFAGTVGPLLAVAVAQGSRRLFT